MIDLILNMQFGMIIFYLESLTKQKKHGTGSQGTDLIGYVDLKVDLQIVVKVMVEW